MLYRITAPDGAASYGMFAMVDTDQISTRADEPGLVIRNEDVFIEKVRERVALAETTGHLLSPVLLLQSGRGDELHQELAAACAAAGAPAATDSTTAGRRHEIWPVPAGPTPTGCARWPAAASWWSPTATTAAWPRRSAACPGSSR